MAHYKNSVTGKVSGFKENDNCVLMTDAEFEAFKQPTLTQSRESKKEEIRQKCKEAIEQGFQSSALGTPTRYRCSQTDQSNLQALIIAGIDYNFEYVVDDAIDMRDVTIHTVAQLQAVFNDGLVHVATQREKKRILFSQIDALTTISEVEVIIW